MLDSDIYARGDNVMDRMIYDDVTISYGYRGDLSLIVAQYTNINLQPWLPSPLLVFVRGLALVSKLYVWMI